MMFLFLVSHFPHLHIHYPPVHTFFSFSVKVLIMRVLFCFGISGLECWRSYHISFWFYWVFSVFKLHVLPFVLLVSFCWRAGPLCLGRRITVNAAQRPWEQEMHQSLPLGNLCLWTANFIVLVAPATPWWNNMATGGSSLRMDRFSLFQLSADGEVILICRNFSSMLALWPFPRSVTRTTVLSCSDSKLQLPTSHAAPEVTAAQQCTTGPVAFVIAFCDFISTKQ